MDSWKFSTSGFRWIYMFWDVLNTIWPFLENVCLSVSNFCGHCISRANAQKVTQLYMRSHFDKNWCWLDFGGYRPIGGTAMPHFSRVFSYLKYLISLGFLHGIKANSDEKGLFPVFILYWPRIEKYIISSRMLHGEKGCSDKQFSFSLFFNYYC